MKNDKNRLRPSTRTTGIGVLKELPFLDDIKNKRIFALVHWSERTGTQILEHGFDPTVLRKHARKYISLARRYSHIKNEYCIVPFEIPRYYFQ